MSGSWPGSPVGGEQAVGAQRVGPSRLWYWVAGAALAGSVVCVVLGVLWWFTSFTRQVDHFQRGPLPGQTVLSFDRPGGYTVYFETDTGPGTSVQWGSGSDPAQDTVTLPPYSMSLAPVGGGEQIPLRPYQGSSTYTSGGHAGQAMRTFHIDTPGSYLLDAVGPRPPVAANVAVGRSTGQSMRVLALALPAALILFGAGLALVVIVAVRRHRASHPRRTPSPWTGTAGYGVVPAGWFPDPGRTHQLRYWDGQTWTEHVADPQLPESQERKTSLISKPSARYRGIVATLAVALLLLVIVAVVQQVADTNNGPGATMPTPSVSTVGTPSAATVETPTTVPVDQSPMTAEELAWLRSIPTVSRKIDETVQTTTNLTTSGLTRLATSLRSCTRELTQGGSPSDRLKPLYAVVKKGCEEYDKGAVCFTTAAKIGIPVLGSPEDRKQTEALDCGFAAAENGGSFLGRAEYTVAQIEAAVDS